MRVLILTADYPPHPWSGIGTAVERQARALAAAGVDVQVLVAAPGWAPPEPPAPPLPLLPPLQRSRASAGAPLPSFAGAPPWPSLPGSKPCSPSSPLRAVGSLPPLQAPRAPRVAPLAGDRFPLDPRSFDWVHVHSLRLAGLALELRRRYGLPLAVTVHGLVHLEQGTTPSACEWSAVQRRLLAAADRVVVLSEAERAAVAAWLPAIASRIRVVPNAAPDLPPALSATPAPITPAGPRSASRSAPRAPIVFAGRFATSKGLDLVAGLAELLTAPGGPGIAYRFVLAGGHGDSAGTAAARRLAGRPRCCLLGWLPPARLDALLRQAALVVVPSRYEPFGLVALDAMAAGAPVLAADTGGLREVAARGSGGRRLATREPRRWAAAARRLLASGEASALGAAGPAWAASRFPAAAVARLLLAEVYGGSAAGAAGAGRAAGGTTSVTGRYGDGAAAVAGPLAVSPCRAAGRPAAVWTLGAGSPGATAARAAGSQR